MAVYAAVPARRSARDRQSPRAEDSPAPVDRRARISAPEAKAPGKERAATAECVNALWKEQRGLPRYRVWGLTMRLYITLDFLTGFPRRLQRTLSRSPD